MNRPEQDLQRACVAFLRQCAPEGLAWTSINPVPAKSKAVAGISKAMGMLAGIPDLLMVWKGRAIFAEFKVDGGKLSPAQRDCHAGLMLAGALVATIRSLDEFIDFLATAGIPIRARIAA
jgi:hypothetical protein